MTFDSKDREVYSYRKLVARYVIRGQIPISTANMGKQKRISPILSPDRGENDLSMAKGENGFDISREPPCYLWFWQIITPRMTRHIAGEFY